jgi:hypothetical protein
MWRFSRKRQVDRYPQPPWTPRPRPTPVTSWQEEEPDEDGGLPPKFTPITHNLLPLSEDGRLSVVGESYYQSALRIVTGGRAAGNGLDQHIPVIAALIPEPENPHDKNAVRIDVVMGRETVRVGYIARDIAPDYQPLLLRLRGQGQLGTCPARIAGGGPEYYGIYLHLAPAAVLEIELTGGDRDIAEVSSNTALLRAEWTCTVTKEQAHQDVLARYAPRDETEPTAVIASLGQCTSVGGKYDGEPAIEVSLGGYRVGELTRAMTARYDQLVARVLDRGLTPMCEAVVVSTTRGLQVELLMPRPRR